MSSHYTAPEMFLYTDTTFKQELNTQHINTKQQMEVGHILSNHKIATNGYEERHSHGRDLTKGELSVGHTHSL